MCSILLAVATVFVAVADEVKFVVQVPKVVAVGQPFGVEFTVNAPVKGIVAPAFENLDMIAGPLESTSERTHFVNGKMTTVHSTTLSFVLVCPSEGAYTIGEATVEVDGKVHRTKPVEFKAIHEQQAQQPSSSGGTAAGQGGAQQQRQQQPQRQAQLAEDDILILATIDRKKVYKGEPVKVSYKLCTRVGLGGAEYRKIPSFAGFWMQRLGTDNRWMREEIGGKIYDVQSIAEYLLFPQQSGTLVIEPMELEVLARLKVNSPQQHNHPFDMFFNGPQIQEVRRVVHSKAIELNVKPLPAGAPKSFNGAVGQIEMDVTLPPAEVVANSAVTYKVRISGRGNLSMIQAPELELPTSFEQYSVKSSESIEASHGGLRGYREFEYPMIARADGDFVIPALEFSFFSPSLGKYVTLSAPEHLIRVTPDKQASGAVMPNAPLVSGMNKDEIQFLGRDIRFIKLGSPALKPEGQLFMFSGLWWLIVVVLLSGIVGVGMWLRNYLKQMRNEATLKGKRANKVALMRLKAAEKNMRTNNAKAFYEEMLRALWGYMSDKLNIPVADLTKESVRDRLAAKGVAEAEIEQYVGALTECEYAQYAPSGSGQIKEAYIAGVEAISRMEEVL